MEAMIPYNTDMEKLVLSEYGRLVHNMIKICRDIADREERTEFAALIVETMKAMTQEKGKTGDDRKYWDHLYIISGGDLDIDAPHPAPDLTLLKTAAKRIPYSNSDFGRRHYGKILQQMVKEIELMPNSADKDAQVELLANHVKKLLVMNNTENATDERVYADLKELSEGTIALEEGIFDLPEYKEEKPQKQQRKTKKNR